MKNISLSLFILLIVIILLNVESKTNKKITPKAIDLKNHYGIPGVGSPYGSTLNEQYTQYVEANPDAFMPFKTDGKKKILKSLEYKQTEHSSNKLNPHFIKSGDMTNIAPSAKKIIKPEIADPKLKVETNFIYPSEVEVAVFKGMKKEFHDVTAYDKKDGKIVHTKVLINKPEYVRERKIMKLNHPHDVTFNLNTGDVISNEKQEKILHGLEPENKKVDCKTNSEKEKRKETVKVEAIDKHEKPKENKVEKKKENKNIR